MTNNHLKLAVTTFMSIISNTYFYLIMMLIQSDWWAHLCQDSTETVWSDQKFYFEIFRHHWRTKQTKRGQIRSRTRWSNKCLLAFSPFRQIILKLIWLFSANNEHASFYILFVCKSMSRTLTNCQWNLCFSNDPWLTKTEKKKTQTFLTHCTQTFETFSLKI